MNPHRTCQENMDALKKVLTQRTLLALSRRNVEFVLAHQADSKQQLADYLRQCRAELGHIPGRTEVIGGDLIELRFRGWANALCASGVPAEQAIRRVHPALTKTDLFQKEFEAQRQLDKRTKAERKKANLERANQDKLRRKAGTDRAERAEHAAKIQHFRRNLSICSLLLKIQEQADKLYQCLRPDIREAIADDPLQGLLIRLRHIDD